MPGWWALVAANNCNLVGSHLLPQIVESYSGLLRADETDQVLSQWMQHPDMPASFHAAHSTPPKESLQVVKVQYQWVQAALDKETDEMAASLQAAADDLLSCYIIFQAQALEAAAAICPAHQVQTCTFVWKDWP